MKIENIDDGEIFAVILTALPEEFSLETGSSIEIYKEEMLYKAEKTVH